MRKIIAILLITSVILGDTLILKNEKVYKGKLVKYVDGKMVMFKALPSANILINISEVQKLTLTDGTKIFENGKILIDDLNNTKKFKDAKRIARIQTFIGCVAIVVVVAVLAHNLEIDILDSGNGGWVPGDNIDLDD